MNTAFLGGNLTDDPELRYTGAGTPVANATLATNERYKDNDGNLVEEATFHDLVIWGDQAEVLSEYADKGQYIVVRGSIQENEWEDRDGNTRRDKEVKVLEFDFGPRNQGSEGGPQMERQEPSNGTPQTQQESSSSGSEDGETFEPDDDLPF